MINTTAEQHASVLKALRSSTRLLNEKVWTYLVATILDTAEDQTPCLKILCGKGVTHGGHRLDPWFEAQPLSPRLGRQRVDHESNSRIDLAFGAVAPRGNFDNGIEFDPAWPESWACFVEAKFLTDSACRITNGPYRNQLERDIESLLCFQAGGQSPARLYFTILTPRKFKQRPRTRLYGYRMLEYQANPALLVQDISDFPPAGRTNFGQVYPNIVERVGVLTTTWATYEDVLEVAFGHQPIDLMDRVGIAAIERRLDEIAAGLAVVPPAPAG